MDSEEGHWAEDDETLEQGFLSQTEDVFWAFNEVSGTWIARRFQGRRLRRGTPKGRGKGYPKGAKGHRRFVPWPTKGKGQIHLSQSNPTEPVLKASGKGKKGKRKGKPGGALHAEGKGPGRVPHMLHMWLMVPKGPPHLTLLATLSKQTGE